MAHSIDSVPIKGNILKEVCLGCVGCTMDMQPFFLLREIETQVFEEGGFLGHRLACLDKLDRVLKPTRYTRRIGCHYLHLLDRLESLAGRLPCEGPGLGC